MEILFVAMPIALDWKGIWTQNPVLAQTGRHGYFPAPWANFCVRFYMSRKRNSVQHVNTTACLRAEIFSLQAMYKHARLRCSDFNMSNKFSLVICLCKSDMRTKSSQVLCLCISDMSTCASFTTEDRAPLE